MEQDYRFYPAMGEQELAEGTTKGVVLGGIEVVLAKVDGTIFAISNRCGHMSTYLSAGELQDHTLKCPLHGAEFDLRTGAVVAPAEIDPQLTANYGPQTGQPLTRIPTRNVRAFRTRIVEGVIQVGIPGDTSASAVPQM
jgi:3-phenylpropionate/trans-cinnamate dioxygenase ferredoxin subunit/anthranilate 1,2-dioxygenase ferredoxin subunit